MGRLFAHPGEHRHSNAPVQYETASLRAITVGGESFPFPLKKKAIEFFGAGKIFEFFGGTETSCVTYMHPEDQLRKPGSCGKPVAGNEIKLLDEKGNEVPQGEVGIMYIKSPFLLDEYYKNPEATQASYHGEYFTVGDMARVDEDGYYYIVDRAVDMVISGGVNIYPAEIEEVLYNHPAIYDVGIIGVPDPDWGERLVAYVVPKPGAEISQEDIKNYVGEKLASYKKPKEVYFVEELPYTPSGKLLKRMLREQYGGSD
ncbi:MAG: AMP-binding protein [Deltaproteobacteria bacterium]|nr:AMP-binding protein [Deltaproteobacteria bacterium]